MLLYLWYEGGTIETEHPVYLVRILDVPFGSPVPLPVKKMHCKALLFLISEMEKFSYLLHFIKRRLNKQCIVIFFQIAEVVGVKLQKLKVKGGLKTL